MKILQICSARQLGGGERHLADLTNSLADRGHNVYAAVIPNSPLILELDRLPRENIVELRMSNSLDLFAARKLEGMVRELKIDIIHAHVARDYTLAAFASAASGCVPFILTRHVLFPLRKLHRKTLGRASRVIAVSDAVAASLKKQHIFDSKKIVTIHNGVDTERFGSKTRGQTRTFSLDGRSPPLLVGMVGHIAPIKGQEIFVRAAADIICLRNDVDFVIVGEDKSRRGEILRTLTNLISHLGLTDRCHLVGWLNEVSGIMPEFDVFVSPSRSEPFGLVMLEAMASGVPVVATTSEGAVEIIENGLTGDLVPVGDAASLASAIIRLLDDPARRERLAANALLAVNDRFSLDRMVDATENLYKVVITRSAQR